MNDGPQKGAARPWPVRKRRILAGHSELSSPERGRRALISRYARDATNSTRCKAAAGAIALYEQAAAKAEHLFDDEERQLVRSAIETAKR